MHINSSQQGRVLRLALDKGMRCRYCGSADMLSMLTPTLDRTHDGVTAKLYCGRTDGRHPYGEDEIHLFTFSHQDARGIGIDTGL